MAWKNIYKNTGGKPMEEEITLDLKDIFDILKKRIKLIVAVTLISTFAAGIVSFFVLPPTYEATVSVFIGKSLETGEQAVRYESSDIMMYQKLIKTYARIAKLNDVAEKAVKDLGGNYIAKDLQKSIKVVPQSDTQILDIKMENKDPQEAKKIVEAVTKSFIAKAKQTIPNGNVQILDKAKVPEKPIKPKKALNVAIAFFLGLMVSVGIVFILEYMDNTIKTEDDIEKYLEIPVIGMVPDHISE